MASIEIKPRIYPIQIVLPILLMDHTTKKNIIFATDSYDERGEDYGAKRPITEEALMEGGDCLIQPRVLKAQEEQLLRTRRKAEVFTPAWVCCLMNEHCDEEWFGRKNVFTRMNGHNWEPTEGKVLFPEDKRWQVPVRYGYRRDHPDRPARRVIGPEAADRERKRCNGRRVAAVGDSGAAIHIRL